MGFQNAPEIRFPHLGIEIGHLNVDAFSLFGLVTVRWYGIFITIAVFTGLFVALREAKRSGQSQDMYFDFFFIVVFACLIGARIYYVLFAWEDYKNNIAKIFAIHEGGLAIYGAIIAAVITSLIYAKIKKYNFWVIMDTGVLGLVIGQAIGRYGNFFNREAFGGFTNSFLAMQYRADTVFMGLTDGIANNLVVYNGASYIQVHPTFLYESLWNIALFILLQFYKKYKVFNGEVFMLYFAGYGAGRFWIEGLRTDQLILFNTGIPVSQLLSALIFIGSSAYIIYRRVTKKAALS